MRRLSGAEIGKISSILEARFDLLSIRTFAKKRLDIAYDAHVSPLAGLHDGIFGYVDYLNRNWKHFQLINAFLAEYPDDPDMLRFAAELGVLSGIADSEAGDLPALSGLQAMVNAVPELDVAVLLSQISRAERTVCRIEVERKDGISEWGTGFLIGEDLLMSNYHVFKNLINTPEQVNAVNCLFDYKVLPDGTDIYKGNLVQVADQNPVVHFSEVGTLDVTGAADLNAEWDPDKLDYAIVKLARKIGSEAFGPGEAVALNGTEKRGWLTFPDPMPPVFRGSHGLIIQHPQKGPKKIVFGFEKIQGLDAKGIRMRYGINTQKGSSGSPCFNHKFELIALHNMGDPNYNPQYNQGIPVDKIKADLLEKGFQLPEKFH